MPRTRIPLLILLLMTSGYPAFSTEEKTEKPAPSPSPQSAAEPQKIHYFEQSGTLMDSLADRVWFKIVYSWEKSGEYFRLACSSVTDSFSTKERDAKARLSIKKDELLEKGKNAVKETAGQAAQELSEKGKELRKDLDKMGSDLKNETVKEIRENTDQLLK